MPLGNPTPQPSQSAIDALRHRLAMQQPQPGLPFGKQKVAPNQQMPFDPAGEPWRGPDPKKVNFGIPYQPGTTLQWDPTFNQLVSSTLMQWRQPQPEAPQQQPWLARH